MVNDESTGVGQPWILSRRKIQRLDMCAAQPVGKDTSQAPRFGVGHIGFGVGNEQFAQQRCNGDDGWSTIE